MKLSTSISEIPRDAKRKLPAKIDVRINRNLMLKVNRATATVDDREPNTGCGRGSVVKLSTELAVELVAGGKAEFVLGAEPGDLKIEPLAPPLTGHLAPGLPAPKAPAATEGKK